MQVNPLYELISQGEHQQQDFKFCINDSRKIARSLVAFANTNGGRLLVGVKDNGRVAGVKTDEEYYMVEAAANIYSKPRVRFNVQEWDVEGKTVLEIIIQPGKDKPYFAQNDEKKWVAYIRRNDENILANKVLVDSWKIEKMHKGLKFTYDEPRKILVDYLSDNESITLSRFCKIAQISRLSAQKILSEFLALKCIAININQQPVVYSLDTSFDVENLNY
jgi:predicted HTH transcriptional regulator